MEWIITIVYIISLLYLFIFSLGQLQLTYIYLKKPGHQEPFTTGTFEPYVTIQLPVYNEKYVVERLIDAIARIEYPREKFEVQILDDSTDETSGIIYQKVQWLQRMGLDVKHIHRENRQGFKAGALQEGLKSAKGEFIVIFDSDFVPEPDFLRKTLPYFHDAQVGVVQTRWGHLNKDYSLMTRLQAFGLDAHFSIEQSARNTAGSFINFNGTCGVWRKGCIIDAGGWSADTLTEDLDLSYRAQLKGWKFRYLEDVVTPGELPVLMPVIKLQQYRWNKGGAETARKLLGHVIGSRMSLRQKAHAFLHLFNSSVFVALLAAGILSIPMLYIKDAHPTIAALFKLGNIFLIGFLSVAIFYWTATTRFYTHPAKTFVVLFPAFLIISMGLSLHNGLAVIEGWLGIKTPFKRTPKFNIVERKDSWIDNVYVNSSINMITAVEGLLAVSFIWTIVRGFQMNDISLVPFHAMLALGFGTVFVLSMKPWANA